MANEMGSNAEGGEHFSDEVAVDGIHVMPRVGIDILPGGCYQEGMMSHLQVVDILNKTCYWIPLGRNALNALIGQATHCLELSDAAGRIVKGGDDDAAHAPE